MAVPRVLTIAGSDSGGGAGIQADLKAIAACGGHGMTAITALTAQSTVGVSGIHATPPDFIVEQVRAVVEDIGVDAVKTGMLGDVPTIEAVDRALSLLAPQTPLVVDPVMIAESGAPLLAPQARGALVAQLLPRATVATPNLSEAGALIGDEPGPSAGPPDPAALARGVHALGPRVVVVTGGHREEATDVFFDGEQLIEIPGPRHAGGAAHGSGCTHASALATLLAYGLDPLEAARGARALAGEAVRNGLRELGRGAGPVDALDVRARTPFEASKRG
jgi:hydroxymethylpyrimidine/phosphomethylpyrimidine kinase